MESTDYYTSRQADIVAVFETHAQAWHPFLTSRYGHSLTESTLRDARARHQALIPQLPYIGGNENLMTRHLIRSTTGLALYQAMRARGKTAQETGKIIYDAVVESVSHLPPNPPPDLSSEYIVSKREEARASQEHRYPGDWVWKFIEGDGVTFGYGYDFFECGTQKLYRAHGAGEFLPFYCFLDFVTYRTTGWSFARTMTLSEGHPKCDFRFREGGHTRKDWPPPFLDERP